MAQRQYQNWGPNPSQIQYLAMDQLLTTVPGWEVLKVACNEITMPRQSGAAIVLRRWLASAVDATPAPEGTQKAPRTLLQEDFNGTMLRYTERYQVSRYAYDLEPWDAVKGAADILAKNMIPSTRERVRFNAALSGTNVLYNSSAISSRATVNGPITPGRIQTIVRSLSSAKGMQHADSIEGANKQGTAPVESGYYWFTHTDPEPEIRGFPGFKLAIEYPNGGAGKKFREFGAFQNTRVFTTPEAVVYRGGGAASTTMVATGGLADVYTHILCGKEALTTVKLAGAGKNGFGNLNVEILDKPDKFDANNNWVDIVASWYDLCMVTSNDWLWRCETATTANL